ncbi:MAG TPA: radical SAM protein, partial [Spirochaetia bacterium]
QTTSRGNPMIRIGQVGGRDNLFFCYQNYCSHFGRNKQCAFCNLVSTSKVYDSVIRRKDHDEVGEVVHAAWAEGQIRHLNITGGCFDSDKEVSTVCDLLSAIRRHTGFDRIPGVLLPSPAKGDAIRRYHDAGISALGYSMEIWDDRLYQAICPGKAETTSHAEFVRAIADAVSVFGPGNVFVMFVMGIETRETFLEGIRALSDLGVNFAPYVWAPNPGSKLSGHRAPFAEWYAETTRDAAAIVRAGGTPSGDRHNCRQCDGNTLLADALREMDPAELNPGRGSRAPS